MKQLEGTDLNFVFELKNENFDGRIKENKGKKKKKTICALYVSYKNVLLFIHYKLRSFC